MRRVLCLVVGCLLALPAGAAEPDPSARLDRVQTQLERSQQRQAELEKQQQALGQEVDTLRPRLITLTAESERVAGDLAELESGLTDLEGAAARRSAALATHRNELAGKLALLQRLALMPPEVQLLSPEAPINRVRADMQIKALLPEIQKRSAEIAATVSDFRRLQADLRQRRQKIMAERSQLTRQRTELSGLLKEREARLAATRQQRTVEVQRAAALADQAHDLQDLIDKLAAEQARAAAARAAAESRLAPERPDSTAGLAVSVARPIPAALATRLPVGGMALVRFGERDSLGNISKGVTLKVRPGAQVVSVAAGRIAFAGPFRGYGRILIVEHATGYHTVLAGLDQVSVEVGQQVGAGEPVGTMSATADPPPQLYYEVRRGGDSVDPLGQGAARLTDRRGR